MTDVNQWSSTDASNNATSPAGAPEGMAPSGVNDTIRAIQGGVRRLRDQVGPSIISAGTANAQTLTYGVAPGAYVTGDPFSFIVGTGLTNTGSATLNVNALGAKTLKIGTLSLSGGELVAGTVATVAYDGTNLQLISAPSAAGGLQVDVFAIGGQSNASGFGTGGPTVPAGKVLQYKSGAASIVDANDPVGDAPNAASTGSAWPAFGLAYYLATGRMVCVVPSAVGGTDQVAATAISVNGNWDTAGTLRATLITNFNSAIAALRAAGYSPRAAGILWCQGENDASGIQQGHITQSDYQTALTTMIAYYRAQSIGGKTYPSLPFYMSQTAAPYAGDTTYYQQIRNAQAAVAAADTTLATIIGFSGAIDFVYSNPSLVSPTAGGSTLHYTQAGYNKMGHDLAQAVLLGGESKSRAALTRQLLSCSSQGVALVAGSTNFIGVGSSSGENAIWHLPPFAGRAKRLRVDLGVAPGVGQSVTATVMVAGVATGISCVISGTNTFGTDDVNEATVLIDQSVTIRLVYSAGAATSSANGRVQLDNP